MTRKTQKTSKFSTFKQKLSKWFEPLSVTAFVIGFVLMSFELIAARIMSPVVGASSYVWTSIIGVIIAALALGYYFGGKVADLRVRRSDISALLLLSALMMCLTYQFHVGILKFIQASQLDLRVQAVLAATILFLPTSFLIGMISPYLARLRLKSVNTTGQTVAQLSALNSVGGIVGTFSTGFVFFAYMGSLQALLVLILITINIAWLTYDRSQLKRHTAIYTAITAVCVLSYPFPTNAYPVSIDTTFTHYQVNRVIYGGRDVTAISTGPSGLQSGVYTDGSKDLAFNYARATSYVTSLSPDKKDILVLGGGAFTLPEYFARKYPDARVTVVEIDPALPEIARKYLRFQDQPNLKIVSEDARTFIHKDTGMYDIIVSDMYNDISVPFSVATTDFTQEVAKRLKPNGIVIANIIGSVGEPCGQLFSSIAHSYEVALPVSRYIPLRPLALSETQNIIGVYGHSSNNWVASAISQKQQIVRDPVTLTDNFAPVEKLGVNCE